MTSMPKKKTEEGHRIGSFRIGCTRAHNTDVVISEFVVKLCDLVFGHVAGSALCRAHFARGAPMVERGLRGSGRNSMAA
jgi:hypothetical protein